MKPLLAPVLTNGRPRTALFILQFCKILPYNVTLQTEIYHHKNYEEFGILWALKPAFKMQ